jgi:hypothetical protein
MNLLIHLPTSLTVYKNEAYEQAIEKVEASGARVEYPVPLPSCDKLTMPDGDMTAMEVVICKLLCVSRHHTELLAQYSARILEKHWPVPWNPPGL